MAIIKPFKAVRPARDKVAYVASRSYQEYANDELKAVLRYNPFSFLHIINPGFKYAKKVSGTERFNLVRNRYLEFLEDDVLVKDATECFYLYKITKGDFSCSGFFCGTSSQDYKNNTIKKHEDTIKRREELFATYLKAVKFNAEPVLMMYKDNERIAKILTSETKKEATYQFTTPDKVSHALWVISNTKIIQSLRKAFEKVDSLYIADGHHRSASSHLMAINAQKENPKHTGEEPYNFFMSYLIPESEIKIYEFNRLIKNLNGLTKEEFLIRLDANYRIENRGSNVYKPSKKHHFSMYLDGDFYALYLRKKDYKFTDALSRLDTQILYKTVLEPILGIKDLRKDKRIHYGYGKYNVIDMKEKIDKGLYTVGFNMVPIEVAEIKAIADAGSVMPPKSTYIEPKLRSGLAIYDF